MQRQAQIVHVAVPQGELPLARTPRPQPVAEEVIHACKTFLDALNLQINICGLDEKEIYVSLKIEASHWSRMRKGEVHFPPNKLDQLCDLCGNEVALAWWAWKRGKGLHMLETESERQLKLEREARAEAEKKVELLTGILKGK
jgi:hypothetical protein